MPENYIGIMCGTSLDSLDLSLCDFEKNKKIKYFKSYRMPQSLRDKINECKNHPNGKKLFSETDVYAVMCARSAMTPGLSLTATTTMIAPPIAVMK